MTPEKADLARVPVLNYHRVHALVDDYYRVRPAVLRRQLEHLLARGYRPIAADRLLDLPTTLSKARYVVISFDDGYDDFLAQAWPILAEIGIPATLFVIHDFIGCRNDWEVPGHLPRRHLNWSELKTLVAHGVQLGSHSRSHPDLTRLDERALRREVIESKRLLERRLGVPVRCFAYPGGHLDERVRALVAEHYDLAFATSTRFGAIAGSHHAIPRFDPSFCPDLDAFVEELERYTG